MMMMHQMMIYGRLAKHKLNDLLRNEKGEVNIVAIVVLIGIAVILAVVFKDNIIQLMKKLFETIEGKGTDAIGKTESGGY